VLALEQENGDYLVRLLEANAETLLPPLSPNHILNLANVLRRFELGPELVGAHIVEHTCGTLESARDTVALLKHEAY
jgi:hypothetical protein